MEMGGNFNFTQPHSWEVRKGKYPLKPLRKLAPPTEPKARNIWWALDDQGVFTLFNRNDFPKRQTGFGDLTGNSVFDVFKNHDPAINAAKLGLMGEDINTTLDVGGTQWQVRGFPTRSQAGAISGLVGVAAAINVQADKKDEEQFIRQLLTALRKATLRSEIPPILLAEIAENFSPSGIVLATLHPDGTTLTLEAAAGVWSELTGKNIPRADDDLALQGDINFLMEHIPTATLIQHPFILTGFPLISAETPIGTLWLANKRPFSQSDYELLRAWTEIAANAINRATQFEQTQLRLRRLAALHEIDTAITNATDLKISLKTITEQAQIQLGVDAAAFMLINSETQNFEFAVGAGFKTNEIDYSRIPIEQCFGSQLSLDPNLTGSSNTYSCEHNCLRSALFCKEGFIAHYGTPLIVRGKVKGILEIFHRQALRPTIEWTDFLETLATQAAIAVDNAELFTNLQQSNAELSEAYETTLEGWIKALDLRDKETEGHTQRVTTLTLELARAMGIDEADLIHIKRGALLHDIGKIGISDNLLLKPDSLTTEEWHIMRQHPKFAHELISSIAFLEKSTDIPHYHHEKWDGTGYPEGLCREEIPLTARIFAVADVWDVLRSDRPYRSAWPIEKTKKYMLENAGTHFDPQIVEKFFELGLDRFNGRQNGNGEKPSSRLQRLSRKN